MTPQMNNDSIQNILETHPIIAKQLALFKDEVSPNIHQKIAEATHIFMQQIQHTHRSGKNNYQIIFKTIDQEERLILYVVCKIFCDYLKINSESVLNSYVFRWEKNNKFFMTRRHSM